MRRCQRLPEVTHPVDSTRPATTPIKSHARVSAAKTQQKSRVAIDAVLTRRRRLTSLLNGLLDRSQAHTWTVFVFEGFRVDFRQLNPLLFGTLRGVLQGAVDETVCRSAPGSHRLYSGRGHRGARAGQLLHVA